MLAAVLSAAALGCFVGGWFGGDLPRVAHLSNPSGDAQVWIYDANSGESVRVSGRNSEARHPRWSNEQQFLAWVTVGSPGQLMVYDSANGDVSMLVAAVDDTQPPVWSPDGGRIAYVSDAEGESDIYMVDLTTRQPTRLTFGDAEERVGDWSPDGEWLVFTEVGRDGLLLRNPEGVNRIPLTDGADSDPVWSPKGDRIAFLRQTDWGRDLYVLRPTKSGNWVEGTDEVTVSDLDEDEFEPSWSLDGRRIAFAARDEAQSEIYTVLVDGTDRRRLTHNRVDDLSPVWSATGDRIVFVSYAYGNAEILYMNGDGGGQKRITTNDHTDTDPDW